MNSFKYIMTFTFFVIYLFSMGNITFANDEYPIPYMYPDWWYLDDWGDDYIYLGVGEYGYFEDDYSLDPDGGDIQYWLWMNEYFQEVGNGGSDHLYTQNSPGFYYLMLSVMDDEGVWSYESNLGEEYWFDYCPICVFDGEIWADEDCLVYGTSMNFNYEIEPYSDWYPDEVWLSIREYGHINYVYDQNKGALYPGYYEDGIQWDGKDDEDEWLEPGIYFASIWVGKDGEWYESYEYEFTVVKVDFSEDSQNQKYGYDDFTYPSPNVICKSVAKDDDDTFLATINPPSEYSNIYFKSSDESKVEVTPDQADQSPEQVKVEGKDLGYSFVKANLGSTSGPTVADSITAVYTLETYSLEIIVVNEDSWTPGISAPFSAQAIENYLNLTYKQACIQWQVSIRTVDPINFDIDEPIGKLNILDPEPKLFTDEMEIIIEECGDLENYNYNIFLVERPDAFNKVGYMPQNQSYGFAFYPFGASPVNPTQAMQIIAHELGHGVGGLADVETDLESPDTENLMYPTYSYLGNKLRLLQWDNLH